MNSYRDLAGSPFWKATSRALAGMKIETEGEGASWDEIHRTAVFCSQVGIPLTLKIGGVDARTDLSLARGLGLSSVTAPMVETEFGVVKFLSALETQSGAFDDVNVLIESKTGLANLEKILGTLPPLINGVNFGRSDLQLSMRREVSVESDHMLELLSDGAAMAKSFGKRVTVGGQVVQNSVRRIVDHKLGELIDRVETRRLVYDWPAVSDDISLLKGGFQLEMLMAEIEAQGIQEAQARWASRIATLKSRLLLEDSI